MIFLPPATDISVGSIYGRTKAVFLQKPLLFVLITFISLLPNQLIVILTHERDGVSLFGFLVSFVVTILMTVVYFYAYYCVMSGKQPSVKKAIALISERLIPLLVLGILFYSAVILAFVAFIVPGLLLLARWIVAFQICAVEDLGPVESLKRSALLTKPYRKKIILMEVILIIGFLLLVFVGAFSSAFIIDGIFVLLTKIFPTMANSFATVNRVAIEIAAPFVLSIPVAFYSLTTVTLYNDLRTIHDSAQIDDYSEIFD